MAKASFTLKNGTTILVEGSPDEIKKILSLYQSPEEQTLRKTIPGKIDKITKKKEKPEILDLVNVFKESDEVELMEKNILDRASQIDRILLPLYIIHKEFANRYLLTSGEIVDFLSQLGITMFQSNVSTALSSTASKYIMGDTVRKRGKAVRYRLSRPGVQYLNSVIQGKNQ